MPQNNRRGIAAHFALPGAQPGATFPSSGLVGGVTAAPAAGAPSAGAPPAAGPRGADGGSDGQVSSSRGTGNLAATGAPLLAVPALLLVGSAVLLRRRALRHRG